MTETKVTAATAGAVTAPALGALIVWVASEFTAVDMPMHVGVVLGGIILAGGGALIAGRAKGSQTSAVSEDFSMTAARGMAAERRAAKRIDTEAGLATSELCLIVIAICVVVALFLDWGLAT